MASGSMISKAYELTSGGEGAKLIDEKNADHAHSKIQDLFKTCGYCDVLLPLDNYLNVINESNVVMFQYMSDVQKKQLKQDLYVAYLLLLAQEQYECDYQKNENSKHYSDKRTECELLLDKLEQTKKQGDTLVGQETMKQAPSKYSFIFIGNKLTNKLIDQNIPNSESVTKTLISNMNKINAKRLYWIWGSSFISLVLSMLPADFFNVSQATSTMDIPNPYTGTLSWALYYLRFSVHLFLFLKNTIKGPWLTPEEKLSPWWTLPWEQRVQIQWQQRKFSLLNDSLWATANLACFFWLIGTGLLGHWGSLLTVVLLGFDTSVSLWDYAEQETLKDEELASFDKEITKLTSIKTRSPEQDHQLRTLRKAQQLCRDNWDYKKYELYNNIGYAIGLMLAFILMTLPFLPLTTPALLALSLVGTVLCFAFSAAYTCLQGTIELYKERMMKLATQDEHDNKIDLFTQLKNGTTHSEQETKYLYLEIQALNAKCERQTQEEQNKQVHFIRSTLMSLFTPGIILACLIFVPTGISLGLLSAYVALLIGSSLLIDQMYPIDEKNELAEIDQQQYLEFSRNPESYQFASKKHSYSFFNHAEKDSASTAFDYANVFA